MHLDQISGLRTISYTIRGVYVEVKVNPSVDISGKYKDDERTG
jgi:hypothetical protein